LMGAKLEQGLRCVWDYYSRKGSHKGTPVPVDQLDNLISFLAFSLSESWGRKRCSQSG
jgi:hypothetical protein